MCAVSALGREWNHPSWPQYIPPSIAPLVPGPNSIPWEEIRKQPDLAGMMLDVIRRLEAIDKKLGTNDNCTMEAQDKRKLKAALGRIAKKEARDA